MKPRDEENLINLAFGELSEEEATRLEQSVRANPKASRALSGYERLKKDLVLLKDIPELQISTERIRGAILGQGLKQRNHAARWGWILVPGLAAALMFGLMLNRPQSEPQNQALQVVPFKHPVLVVKNDPNPVVLMNTEIDPTNVGYSFSPDRSPRRALRSDRHAHRSRSASRRPESQLSPLDRNVMQHGITLNSPLDQVSPETSPSPQTSPRTSAVADSMSPASPTNQRIVVVNDEKDKATGAQQATEVNSNANVVVGG